MESPSTACCWVLPGSPVTRTGLIEGSRYSRSRLRWREPRRRHPALMTMAERNDHWGTQEVLAALERDDLKKALKLVQSSSQSSTEKASQVANGVSDVQQEEAAIAFQLMNSIGREMIEEGEVMSSLYRKMQQKGWLSGFGVARGRESWPYQSRVVSPQSIEEQAGLPYTALRAKRSSTRWWQFAGVSVVLAIAGGLQSVGLGEYARPTLLGLFGVLALDQTLLRGLIFDSVYRVVSPGYAEKLRRHEAGHFLVAYLVGSPVLGYVLNAKEAFKRGIPGRSGQAMTLFSDPVLAQELKVGQLTDSSIDRHAIILMAGIAAEALHYGEAEGGASDESVLVALLTNLNPPWRSDRIVNEARWAALQAILLIKKYSASYEELVKAMEEEKPLGECVQAIESRLCLADSACSEASQKSGSVVDKEFELREERRRQLVSDINLEVDRSRIARDLQLLEQKKAELDQRSAELARREREFKNSLEIDPTP